MYVKFYDEEDAEACVKGLENRWFNGEPIYAELSPVTNFREACCRQVANFILNLLRIGKYSSKTPYLI